MKKLFLALIILIFPLTILSAKSVQLGQVKGQVIEANTNRLLQYATIIIQAVDSTIIGGATTNANGDFSILKIPYGEHTMIVTLMGYKDLKINIKVDKNLIDLSQLTLEEDIAVIDGAVVSARLPLIEQKVDKLVMNISESVSSTGGNGIDILRKAPGVSIDYEGNIKLNGNVVDVWIDGRPSYLSGKELESLLASTDASSVEKIEIMSHPSSKYDASGSGGIINIITKKNFLKGFNGSIRAGYGGMYINRYFQDIDGTINLSYRSDKTNTFLMYSPGYNSMGIDYRSETKFGQDYKYKEIAKTDFTFNSMSHQIRGGNDWYITKKDVFGFIVNSTLRDGKSFSFTPSENEIFYIDNIISRKITDISNPSYTNSITGNINYTHTFNETKAQELTLNADYAYYDIGENNIQNQVVESSASNYLTPEVFRSNTTQYINIVSAKADYQQMFWKTGVLEFGAKWVKTFTNNNTVRTDFIGQEWINNENLSNKFKYNEQVASLYATASKMFGEKWSAKLGLRSEYTYSEGNWITSGSVSKKSYINLFPTAYVGYTPTKNWRLSLSYSMRVKRPSYSQLNPFMMTIDASTIIQGNPNITPQFSDNLVASVGYKSFLTLSLLYTHNRDFIMQKLNIDPVTGKKIMLWSNCGTQDMVGGSVALSELSIFKWLVLDANIYAGYNKNVNNTDGFVNEGLMTSAYGNFTFLLPKDWKIEFGGFYQGTNPWGDFIIHPSYMFFGGVKKNMMGNKATLSLKVDDIFRTFENNLSAKDVKGETYMKVDQKMYFQKVSLSFVYRFGQSKASKYRNVGNLDESSRVGSSSSIGGK